MNRYLVSGKILTNILNITDFSFNTKELHIALEQCEAGNPIYRVVSWNCYSIKAYINKKIKK